MSCWLVGRASIHNLVKWFLLFFFQFSCVKFRSPWPGVVAGGGLFAMGINCFHGHGNVKSSMSLVEFLRRSIFSQKRLNRMSQRAYFRYHSPATNEPVGSTKGTQMSSLAKWILGKMLSELKSSVKLCARHRKSTCTLQTEGKGDVDVIEKEMIELRSTLSRSICLCVCVCELFRAILSDPI